MHSLIIVVIGFVIKNSIKYAHLKELIKPTEIYKNFVNFSFNFISISSGRSYSKDSQKSSQSDLSLASVGGGVGGSNAGGGANNAGVISTGSPKTLAKTPMSK